MLRLRNIILILTLLAFTTCVSPYVFDFDEEFEPSFVVDGYLTDVPQQHAIRVSRSTLIGDFNGVINDFVTTAIVSIIDDLGNEISLTHDRNGIYLTPPNVAAQPGRSYKVRVELVGNRTYESSFETLSEPLEIENEITYDFSTREVLTDNGVFIEESGLQVTANIQKAPNNRYYRWEIDHYFIVESDLAPEFENPQAQQPFPDDVPRRFCFVKDFPVQQLHLLRDVANNQATGQNYTFDLEFLEIDKRFEYQFIIESTLLALPKESHDYWSNIQNLAENTGGLFDAAPFEVIGNMRDVTNDTEEEIISLGYFGVYYAEVKRIYITPQDLGIFENQTRDCTIPPSPSSRPHPCADCRLYTQYLQNFEDTPPSWWDFQSVNFDY